jgi:hypothetical protein
MRWFNDVWMKEVFANFMADKIVNPSFPTVNHELRFLLAHYPSAYSVDRTAGTNAIRQVLGNLDEAGQMYGPIIYDKAPVVMRQLEMIMGAGPFRDGLREYLKTVPVRQRHVDRSRPHAGCEDAARPRRRGAAPGWRSADAQPSLRAYAWPAIGSPLSRWRRAIPWAAGSSGRSSSRSPSATAAT